jgi:Ser/Thr protein kinase RdoA (MazF antagonist)
MSQNNVWGADTQFFYSLTPDVIDRAIAMVGLKARGRVMALNSLENRVYEVDIQNYQRPEGPYTSDTVVIKFYRPGRWTKECILEEHNYLLELNEFEIPVTAPLLFADQTLFVEEESKLFFAIFPKVVGRLKDELKKEEIEQVGRLIGRIHNIGDNKKFQHRPTLNVANYLDAHLVTIESASILPPSKNNYLTLARQLSQLIKPKMEHLQLTRIHGDVHRGNVLWTNFGPWMVDFDDCVMGPKQQDLWLLLPGRDEYSLNERAILLESYHSMARMPVILKQHLVEALRAIRMIHFNGWITKRYEDPTFIKMYPHFTSENYWDVAIQDVREQLSLVQDYEQYQ